MIEIEARSAIDDVVPAKEAERGVLFHTIVTGTHAVSWSRDLSNRLKWDRLWAECPWSTAFQSHSFFDIWTRHYGDTWSPLLVLAYRPDGSLAGLMPLAMRNGVIVGVGAHQAEYQGWISSPQESGTFIVGALGALTSQIRYRVLRLRYLPIGLHSEAIDRLRSDRRAILFKHGAPILPTGTSIADGALKKPSNRSKLKRLQRLGNIEFRVLDVQGFIAALNSFAVMYDLRHGALHGVRPFSEDSKKRDFHIDWFRVAPEQLHASCIYLDEHLISALLLVRSSARAHLAISAYCPQHSQYSPGKLNIYLAAQVLKEVGIDEIDLTPGGDPWKARFGRGESEVAELVFFPTHLLAIAQRFRVSAKEVLRSALGKLGLRVSYIKTVLGPLRRRPMETAQGQEIVFIRGSSHHVTAAPRGGIGASVNCLDDVMYVAANMPADAQERFLKDALLRFERGDTCGIALDAQRNEYCVGWARRISQESAVLVLEGVTLSADAEVDIAAACVSALLSGAERENQIYDQVIFRTRRDQVPLHQAATQLGFELRCPVEH